MTTEQIELYKELGRQCEAAVVFGYCNSDLDELVCLPNFHDLAKQMPKELWRNVRAYRTVRKIDGSLGNWQIRGIELAVAKLKSLLQKELNARWLVKDKKTGLYWSRMIEPPYWDKRGRAFLFCEQASAWAKRLSKAAALPRFIVEKVDATKRLQRPF